MLFKMYDILKFHFLVIKQTGLDYAIIDID